MGLGVWGLGFGVWRLDPKTLNPKSWEAIQGTVGWGRQVIGLGFRVEGIRVGV